MSILANGHGSGAKFEGRSTRSHDIGSNVTHDEEARILAGADPEGKVRGEWVCEKLLEGSRPWL
ncbi:MAG: hypothetical protein WA399_00265, partial [Acidobacteriaceae bacterium]